jgi:hypothetical protein
LIAVVWVADVLEIGEKVGVLCIEVRGDQRGRRQVRLQEAKNGKVEVVAAVQEQQIDWPFETRERLRSLPGDRVCK